MPVYNLTVERDHEFVADGVLVSNCLEGGFDAAMDNMQLGEVPTVSPTDPNVILSDEIKERLQKRIDEERDVDGDRDSW